MVHAEMIGTGLAGLSLWAGATADGGWATPAEMKMLDHDPRTVS